MSYKDKYKKLKKAVEALIASEYHFRLGPMGICHSEQTQDWFVKATCDLREVVSGHEGLRQAAKAIGVSDIKVAEPKKKRRALLEPDKNKIKRTKLKGLFN